MNSPKSRSSTFPKCISYLGIFTKSKERPRKRKEVLFASSKQYIPPLPWGYDNSEWYQAVEYAEFRNQSTDDAENVVARMNALANCITYAYDTAERIASNALDETSFTESLEKMEPDFQLLLWCNAVWSRGNEKCILNTITNDEFVKARLRHRTRILESQTKCNDEALRLQSENLTGANRVFARMIGVADARVALRLPESRRSKKPLVPVEVEDSIGEEACLSIVPYYGELPQPRQFCALQA